MTDKEYLGIITTLKFPESLIFGSTFCSGESTMAEDKALKQHLQDLPEIMTMLLSMSFGKLRKNNHRRISMHHCSDVHCTIIDASYSAIFDSITYKLFNDLKNKT